MKTLYNTLTILILMLMATPIITNAQVRSDIYSFSDADRDTLGQLMLDYLDSLVVTTHNLNMPMVHWNPNFLPFHRAYVAGMEDFLILSGHPEFVPLPKWDPADSISSNLQFVDFAACTNANGGGNCNPLVNTNSSTARQIPASFVGSALCTYNYNAIIGTPPFANSVFESPWHGGVHVNIGGVMSQLKSPSAVIFWPWHAYLDDVWKEWECNCNGAPAVDLWMRDTPMKLGMSGQTMNTMAMDRGLEPNYQSVPHYMWISQDIWVRNEPDGFTTDVHENPEFSFSSPVYVYVRVRNRGCNTSSGNETLVLHWAKAATALSWPNHWNGTTTIGGPSGPSAGDTIALQAIDSIKAGGSTIVKFIWTPPNPDDYNGINTQPWHFCLLARMVDTNDPMAFAETSDLYYNVRNNNNIAWKNVTVVNNIPGLVGGEVFQGGVVAVGNVFDHPETFDFEFLSLEFEKGEIYKEAEVLLTLDEVTWQKWVAGGRQAENIEVFREGARQLIVKANNAWLRNFTFGKDERSTMNVTFNFLTKEVTEHTEFDYHVVQHRTGDQKIIGGEKYHIVKLDERQLFMANNGPDESIYKTDSVQLTATDIGEPAVYNWYNSEGELVYTGKDFTVSPEFTQEYKLEVIAQSDGYKDYDEVTVNVQQYEITSLFPNPSSSNVTVNYDTDGAASAYLQLMMPYGTTSNQYMLNVDMGEIIIDVSNYQVGVYNVVLVVDGQAVDSKSLLVQ